ncbi:hypothetical protein D1BOALGB6SA_1736 [Olavius sp. associated proteobacterium Delta 1]|nr:hypothetical protein D1BOALGB6SA_1736 [Olavius sp. associated proteobacterium Delta 1]
MIPRCLQRGSSSAKPKLFKYLAINRWAQEKNQKIAKDDSGF